MEVVDKKAIKARLKMVDELRTQLKKSEKSTAKDVMTLLKLLMNENPLIEGLRWDQYTPNYSDGDPCEFNVMGPHFKFSEQIVPRDSVDEVDDDDLWLDAEYDLDKEWFAQRMDILNHKQIAALKKAVKEAYTAFTQLSAMEDTIQEMFGDGYRVTVTRSGVEVEEFDHD